VTPEELQAGFHIGDRFIEPRLNRIVRDGIEVHLESRVMDVLVCLAAHAGHVVSRETLNAQVWRDVVVTDQAVTNCISELRHHLGDDRSANRVIETIPKRGYRLTAPVRPVESPPPPQRRARPARMYMVAGVSLLAVMALGSMWWWNSASTPALTSIAVASFENAAGEESLD
jgi:DNA-binding winged helix-turn-helix (wHTH) protein